MICGRQLSAIVPARGGSKGIPRKNIYMLGGLSLLERSVRLARRCAAVDTVMVSTEDPEIRQIAQEIGAATPMPRPVELASDTARTIDVIRDLVETGVLGADGCILLMQPTTPLRTLADLNAVCALFEQNWDRCDAVVSVAKADGTHPYKAQMIRDGFLTSVMGHDSAVPRQSLPSTFLPNGAFYLAKTRVLFAEDTFMPDRTMPYEMPAISSINLDGPLDLLLLEAVVAKGMAGEALSDSGH